MKALLTRTSRRASHVAASGQVTRLNAAQAHFAGPKALNGATLRKSEVQYVEIGCSSWFMQLDGVGWLDTLWLMPTVAHSPSTSFGAHSAPPNPPTLSTLLPTDSRTSSHL